MLISMTPNEEVKTIHASLNDGSLRKWEFEPYTENGKIELTDQDYAAIQSIKGNTVKFNQLVQNGNFADTSIWITEYTTFSVSNNVVSVTGTRNGNNYIMQDYQGGGIGHKYFFRVDYYTPDAQDSALIAVYTGSTTDRMSFTPTKYGKWLTYKGIIDNDASATTQYQIRLQSRKNGVTNQFRNCVLFDLTQMFGVGNEPTTVSDFETWLSNNIGLLPYYDYTLGSLISFNGTGLKTTGKNLFNKQDTTIQSNGVTYDLNDDGSYTISGTPTGYSFVNSYCNVNNSMGVITISGFDNATNMCCDVIRLYDSSNTMLFETGINSTSPITIDLSSYPTVTRMAVGIKRISNNVAVSGKIYFQMEFGNQATAYEPYTENTLSLPIIDKFPDGMDGVGTTYDEHTPTDYYKRMGILDLGNLNWIYWSTKNTFSVELPNSKNYRSTTVGDYANIVCDKYVKGFNTNYSNWNNNADKSIFFSTSEDYTLCVRDTSYTSANDFKTAMANQYLVYELGTPLQNYGVVDLGNLNWEAKASVNSNYRMQSSSIADIVKKPSTSYILANIICAKYKTITGADAYNEVVGIGIDADGNIRVYDTNYNTSTSAEAFKQAMSGVYLLYELETPVAPSLDLTYPIWNGGTEQILPVNGSTPTTSPMVATIEYPDRTEDVNFLYKQTTFESAIPQFSLVCKNQELPMTLNDDKLVCECDSSITNESGFFDCKVKMQDLDSVAYSQKIQLHVERGIND